MVKIDKTGVAIPPVLAAGHPQNRSTAKLESLLAAVAEGKKKLDFDSAIYGHATVKELLIKLQHDKCCFCESFLTHVSYGDVEHYRPKGGFHSRSKEKMQQPGYYWLAYDFENLFLSCQICNQKFKKNFFPLADESKRIRTHEHTEQLSEEDSLVLNPGKDNPALHIFFNREVPMGLTDKGKMTILRTGLDRKKLNNYRGVIFKLVNDIARHAQTGDVTSQELIREAAQSNQHYSLMVRCNFSDLI